MEVTEVPSYNGPSKASKRPSKPRSTLKRKPSTLKRAKAKKRVSLRKPKTVSKLMKEADILMSRSVRLTHADENGMVKCYTCPYVAHYKKMQNGHYISRFYKKYRFAEKNTRPQCSMCNLWKSGDTATFRINLVKELGVEPIEAMESDYKELFRLTADFLEERIANYKALINTLDENTPSQPTDSVL